MDSNKVRKNQNQKTCILKARDYLIRRFIYAHQQLQEHCQTTANINIECSLTKCHFGQHEDPGYAFGAIPFLATTFVPWRNRMYPWTSLWYFWICNIPSNSWNAHIMVVCRYFCFLISSFISIKDTYSLALAGEHMLSLSQSLCHPSEKDFEYVKIDSSLPVVWRTHEFGMRVWGTTSRRHTCFVFIFFPFNLIWRLIRRHLWSKCFCWILSQAQQFT